MLILTRKPGESIYIGDTIKITIVELKGHQIRVGIDAPEELRIYREEIYLQILEENRRAAEASQSADLGLEGLTAAWDEQRSVKAEEAKPEVEAGEAAGEETVLVESRPGPRAAGFSSFITAKARGHDPQVVFKRRRNKKLDE